LAFNSIGWKSQNFLFNAVDALIGDPLISGLFDGEVPAAATATIRNSVVVTTADVTVSAVNAAQLNATVSNAADSTASAMYNATGQAVGGLLASNKVSTSSDAAIVNSSVTAGGAVTVTATDAAGIFSNIKVVSSSITTNDGGTRVLQDEVNNFLRADYLSTETASTGLAFGDRVRIAADQATDEVRRGTVYQWMGDDVAGPVDLTTQVYTDLRFWKPLSETTLVPQGVNFTNSDSVGIGAAIVLNDVNSSVSASIVGSDVSGASVSVEALEVATIVALTDVTAHSAGGSTFTGEGTSLAAGGVIATNRILSSVIATIDDASVSATAGDVVVSATNASSIEATALSAMSSGAQSVGIELAFNTIGWGRTNLLFAALDALLGDPLISTAFGGSQPAISEATIRGSSFVNATGSLRVSAGSTATITSLVSNAATSAPQAIMGAGGMSAAAILSSNRVNSAARASIDASTVEVDGDVTVEAADDATIDATTTLFSEVSPTNDLGNGIMNQLAGALLDDYQFTSHSGTRLIRFGDKVRTDDGTVYRFMGTDQTRNLSEALQDYSEYGYWKPLSETNLITDAVAYAALSALGPVLDRDGLTGAAASYFGLIDYNDLRSEVRASITATPVRAGGVVSVIALEKATLSAADESLVKTWEGFGAVIVTNTVLASARAWIEAPIVTSGGVVVNAENTAALTASATSKIEGFDKTFGAVVAFNSIGWKASNVLFNALDALMGDPLISSAFNGEQASDARAWIRDTTLLVTGDITVTATQSAELDATVGADGAADAQLDAVLAKSWQTNGVSGGGALASNKVNTLATAFIEFTSPTPGTVDASGDVTITATDVADLQSHSTVVQSAVVSNTAEGLAQFVSDLLPDDNDFTTKSGTQRVTPGSTRVRVAADDGALGTPGHVYQYAGSSPVDLDLGAQDYTSGPWIDLTVAPNLVDFYPDIGNLTPSSARAIGILVLLNDLRASSEAYIDNAIVGAGGSVAVTATEAAQLLSEATSTVEASGGSFKGGGDVQAINGQVVTNVVLASASARISDSEVTAGADVTVAASNHAGVDATLMVATNSGELALSISLAFNSLGWNTQNILFNLVDTVLGSPVIASAFDGENPSIVSASITNSTID
ncbi:MAG TPA: hypothetical protein VGK49_04625, partial [Ilumatobacteraceae bacterium]